MKKRFLLFTLLSIMSNCYTLQAQWTNLGDQVLPNLYRVWSIKIAEDNSIWTFSTYDNFPPPANHFPTVNRSADGGTTWAQSSVAGTGGLYSNDIGPIDSLRAFISINKPVGLYKTTDGGQNWVSVENYPYNPLIVHFFNENDGWVLGSETISPYTKVFSVTDNGGGSWTHFGGNSWTQPTGTSLPSQPFIGNYGLTFSVGSLYDVAGDNIILGRSNGKCWISTDKGYNWVEVATPLTANGLLTSNVSIKDSLTFIVVGDTQAGSLHAKPTKSYTTKDGGLNWIPGNPNITAGATHYIPNSESAFIISGHNNFGSGAFGTAISYNYGLDWEYIDDNRLLAMDFNSLGEGVASCCNGQWTSATGAIYKWEFELPLAEREVINIGGLQLFPNPASEFVNIQLNENKPLPLQASLFDTQGKLVRVISIATNGQVNVQDLSPGMYVLKAVDGQQVYIGKFVKQ